MKTDIDSLMVAYNLDAILVVGPGQHNPPMVYLTGGAHLTRADLVKKRGQPAILIHAAMERDEAARSGLPTRSFDDFQFQQILIEARGDLLAAYGRYYERLFVELGLERGRVGVYGLTDAGEAYAVFHEVSRRLPDLELVGEVGRSMLLSARSTKSQDEIERIRKMGQVATGVIGQVAEFLTSFLSHDGVLVNKEGVPLTIGDVKRRIDLWLMERGAENPKGTIFAIGYDAGVPHSTGNASDFLRLGQTIVFDLFPCEAGGGYFYDITRTWCLGYAPDETLALYEDVLHVYRESRQALRLGSPCRDYQVLACDLFEARGHPTLRSDPETTAGYVHSLGHGLGLSVHELPMFRATASDEERLLPGVVITVEPGLYYPDRGLGIRLEDTVLARPDGVFETLAEYPLDLVLPVKH